MVPTHRRVLAAAGAETVTVLDAPFGFQENADELTRRIGDYATTSLGVDVVVASLRRPGGSAAAVERMLAAVRRSRAVFAGPGSPSYALRVWRGTGIVDALAAVVDGGGTVTLASAAALTAGRRTLPVYEIYKVGEDPCWLEGLDLTGRLGLDLTVVPHWNNAEGGTHDTSCCFIGRRRFGALREEVDTPVLGVDEHTAVVLDLGERTLTVEGVGAATILSGEERVVPSGTTVPLDAALRGASRPAAALRSPGGGPEGLPAEDVLADAALESLLAVEADAAGDPSARPILRARLVEAVEAVRTWSVRADGLLAALVDLRERARREGRFADADRIRAVLTAAGYEVRDGPGGPEVLGP